MDSSTGDEGWVPVDVAGLRSIQLEVLDGFVELCARRQLRWFLCGGSLLGAVRHHGYIPWDDDIDVMMPRRDYDVFLSLARDLPSDGPLQVSSLGSDPGYPLPFAKVWRHGTRITEPSRPRVGVGIDVFPVDARPAHTVGLLVQTVSIAAVRFLLASQVSAPLAGRAGFKGLLREGLRRPLRVVPPQLFAKVLTRLARRSPQDGLAAEAGVVVWGIPDRVSAGAFASSVPVSFEGRSLPAPVGWEEWLHEVYGDYLTLPPESARRGAHPVSAVRWTPIRPNQVFTDDSASA